MTSRRRTERAATASTARGGMEPFVVPARVCPVNPTDPSGPPLSLEDFYAFAYPRLVRALTVMAASRAEAEELVQDAFVKLVPRWDRVGKYDQPESWIRQVAVRTLISRRRRWRVALAAQASLAVEEADASSAEDRLDVRAALDRLPVLHRVVLVLHHGYGMPLQAISDELGVPVGTVKSRLTRGRAAFVGSYDAGSVRSLRHARQESGT